MWHFCARLSYIYLLVELIVSSSTSTSVYTFLLMWYENITVRAAAQLSAVLWNIWKQNRNNIFCIKMVNFPLHWKHSAPSQLTIGWQFEILYICLKSFRTETTLLEKTTSIWFQLEMDHITFGNVYLSTLGCLMENNLIIGAFHNSIQHMMNWKELFYWQIRDYCSEKHSTTATLLLAAGELCCFANLWCRCCQINWDLKQHSINWILWRSFVKFSLLSSPSSKQQWKREGHLKLL